MATKAAQKIALPGFRYGGFDVPALDLSPSLIDGLGTSEQAYKLAPKSVPLSWKVGLYMVGRDLGLGSQEADALPGPVKEAGRMVYSDAQKRKAEGVWHKDGVLFVPRDQAPKGMLQPNDSYALARYFKNTDGFEQKGDVWTIKPSPQTEETLVWLPKGGGSFVVPTMDGLYNPITGTPFETIGNKEEAIKRLVKAGLTEQLPNKDNKEISRFYRADSGARAVVSWSNGDYGPLCVDVSYEPWFRSSDIGSFAASRSAERSEAPKNSGYKLLTSEELRAFEADRTALEAVRKAVGK